MKSYINASAIVSLMNMSESGSNEIFDTVVKLIKSKVNDRTIDVQYNEETGRFKFEYHYNLLPKMPNGYPINGSFPTLPKSIGQKIDNSIDFINEEQLVLEFLRKILNTAIPKENHCMFFNIYLLNCIFSNHIPFNGFYEEITKDNGCELSKRQLKKEINNLNLLCNYASSYFIKQLD